MMVLAHNTDGVYAHQSKQNCAPCISASATVRQPFVVSPKRVFIFGIGYTTLGLANRLSAGDGSGTWQITGSVRSHVDRASLQKAKHSWELVSFDPCNGEDGAAAVASLERCTHVLSSIPPVGLPLYDPALNAQLRAISAANHGQFEWLGYLSSTGVYGDHAGAWVDERTECKPAAARSLVRLQHEQRWVEAAAAAGLPLHIFRLGGIYGPGRSLLSEAGAGGGMRSSSKVRRGQQRYISRAHVLDICRAVAASMAMPTARAGAAQIFNIADDEPAPRQEVLRFVRSLLAVDEAAPQQHQGAETTEALPALGIEEKRVLNARMKDELGVSLVFPTYREGMSALAAGDLRPFDAADLEWLGLRTTPQGGVTLP